METMIVKYMDNGREVEIEVPKQDYEIITALTKGWRSDANETVFLIKELEHKKAKTYDELYKELKYSKLLPIDTSTPNGASEVAWDSYSKVGEAAVIAHYAQNVPRVDVFKIETKTPIRRFAAMYGYDREEVRKASFANVPLDSKRVDAVRRAIEQKHNNVAWNGDDDYNLQGFIDYPGTLTYTIINDGTGNLTAWTTKTPDQIIRDLNGMISSQKVTTNDIEVLDTIIMPIANFELIASTPRASNSDETILSFFLRTRRETGMNITVETLPELTTAGAGSTARMMGYRKNIDKVAYQIPLSMNMLPPEQKGLGFDVNVESKTGGVTVYYPFSVIKADGI